MARRCAARGETPTSPRCALPERAVRAAMPYLYRAPAIADRRPCARSDRKAAAAPFRSPHRPGRGPMRARPRRPTRPTRALRGCVVRARTRHRAQRVPAAHRARRARCRYERRSLGSPGVQGEGGIGRPKRKPGLHGMGVMQPGFVRMTKTTFLGKQSGREAVHAIRVRLCSDPVVSLCTASQNTGTGNIRCRGPVVPRFRYSFRAYSP